MSNQKMTTFFMFNGKAEEAINFYTSLFNDSEINRILYKEDGSVLHASFRLKGQSFMAIDSGNKQEHAFSPSISIFVSCDNEEEINHLFEQLSEDGGLALMPLAPSPVSKKFGWVQDKYGVSWQLNLANS